ncbi:MAG TPA: hypothetical protein PK971_12935 [Saprospiraceae bacterium]|nr:hypothetical protein [Saprospiraceae bacterium]HND89232.1 hypothetical protein [Saprospiraceae bacterium]HNG89382.1 hypothetical protein [Saprospiraceae bacterium]
MKRIPDDLSALETYLRPETELERHLLWVPEFRHGLLWGEPRFGHPEGQIALHIREVLDNIDRVPHITPHERTQLRLIAWLHDTFKYAEDRSRPRDWNKHHGILARAFLEPYTHDRTVLDIVAMHDDAYYIWLDARHALPSAPPNGKSLHKLLHDTAHCLQLYYTFFKCDTQTGDKTQAPVRWFEGSVKGIRIFQLK